jgi:hypothetical protein
MTAMKCPTCDSQLKVLKACGCRDYWCDQCKKLISKKHIVPDIDANKIDSTRQNE